MQEAAKSPYVVRFETFEVNLRSRELRQNGQRLKLPEQSFQILEMLLERAGDVVMRKDIQKRLWPNDTIVEFENSINAAVKRLRLALGDPAENPRYIATLARRGYRWMTPIEWVEVTPGVQRPNFVEPQEPHAPPSPSSISGKKISHYRVLEMLGGGGMGIVYKAEDIKLGRRVALKFLPEELSTDAAAMERFKREARAASALNHPNICTIHAVEEHSDQPFIAMELLEGQTLGEMLAAEHSQQSALVIGKFIDIAIQIAEGLDAAHNKGIIHRDIKPANIFITTHGQAKILDFGVAKLLTSEGSDRPSLVEQSELGHACDIALTRTGVAIGTAGYMSPEQVRGEMIDARTDLFSFGLILYEMATGQRAFTGQTAAIVHHAIVNDAPADIRSVDSNLPRKLEYIINKALEKDRANRYQTASEIRDDLKSLKQQLAPEVRSSNQPRVIAALATLLLIAGAIFWFAEGRRPAPKVLPEVHQRQVTFNSFENSVRSGSISPDGRYVAYADDKQMFIKEIATGINKLVPPPDGVDRVQMKWNVGPWYPDGTKFLANAEVDAQPTTSWAVPVSGDALSKLNGNATVWSVSPDGASIGFTTTPDDHELWLMNARGENARKLYNSSDHRGFSRVQFSFDGKRLLFLRDQSESHGQSIESGDLQGGAIKTVVSASEMSARTPECHPGCTINDFLSLPDGRLVFVLKQLNRLVEPCSLWIRSSDALNQNSVSESQRITNWSADCIDGLSATADGKQLSYIDRSAHMRSYVADLTANGAAISSPRHFPMTESSDGAVDWTPDSKAIIFVSNNSGRFRIYRQALDEDAAQPLLLEGYGRDAHLTPDGKWILFLGGAESGGSSGKPQSVMRVPITGGRAETIFYANSSVISCAKSPSNVCVIDEPTPDHKQSIISSLDPFKGRGPELARYNIDPNQPLGSTAVSPDGTLAAYTCCGEGAIYIRSLLLRSTKEIRVKNWRSLQSVRWAADGQALYVSSDVQTGKILRVDLSGNVNVLWESPGARFETIAIPSPDGRHIALSTWTGSGNMWMLDNF